MFHDFDEKIERLEIGNTDRNDCEHPGPGVWMNDWNDWYYFDREDVRIVAKFWDRFRFSGSILGTVTQPMLHS